ncbi:hypothetical protein NHX12_028742 [Muraenolepis orangiensis]|uniref:THAP-type domain-containing protein n=1 Tax=Muraenolepis orangiensis TaxID=630683 RepID=A0A9Q0IP42_9TELE|nr:hypothetical protein NHX12_028742 [Muraenolepis orangiensis]
MPCCMSPFGVAVKDLLCVQQAEMDRFQPEDTQTAAEPDGRPKRWDRSAGEQITTRTVSDMPTNTSLLSPSTQRQRLNSASALISLMEVKISGYIVVGCAAYGCTNRSEKGFGMYGFPRDTDRRKKWLAMVSRRNTDITRDYNSRKLSEIEGEIEGREGMNCTEENEVNDGDISGDSDRRASLPGAREPGASVLGARQQGACDPGARQQGACDPGASQPGASQPGASV